MRQAIILASGLGSRLSNLTENLPKPMLKLGQVTLIERQLQILSENHIKNIIVTTGFKKDLLESHTLELSKKFGINIDFVCNENFESTNYIYSLWLAQKAILSDILLLHGDLVFNSALVSQLLIDDRPNLVLINKLFPPPEKDFKGVVENGEITGIGINFHGNNAFYCAPFYKLSKNAISSWLKKIGEYVESGQISCYAEDALNEVASTMHIEPFYYENGYCMEIDTTEDFRRLNEYLEKNIDQK